MRDDQLSYHEGTLLGRLGLSSDASRLRAGYPLLEQELTNHLNMSRTPVRAAIERLKHDGLVEIIRRKGILVKPLTAADVEQAHEVAEGLEGMMVKLATLRASDTELKELLEITQAMMAAAEAEDPQQWAPHDKQFHHCLLVLARNPLIEASLARVAIVIERARFLRMNARDISVSSRDHRAVVEAMLAREGEKARQLHQQHWQHVREDVTASLRTNLGGEVFIR